MEELDFDTLEAELAAGAFKSRADFKARVLGMLGGKASSSRLQAIREGLMPEARATLEALPRMTPREYAPSASTKPHPRVVAPEPCAVCERVCGSRRQRLAGQVDLIRRRGHNGEPLCEGCHERLVRRPAEERKPRATHVTDELREQIRQDWRDGKYPSFNKLGEAYDLHRSAVSRIVRGDERTKTSR